MSQNLQNLQNQTEALAAPQPCRRWKAAGWRAFPGQEKGFDGFVIKNSNHSANRGTSALCATCVDGLTVLPFPVRLSEA